MKISAEHLELAVLLVGLPLWLVSYFIFDRVVRHISARNGHRYSALWPFNPVLAWRFSPFAIYRNAAEIGMSRQVATLYMVWTAFCAVLLFVVLGDYVEDPQQ